MHSGNFRINTRVNLSLFDYFQISRSPLSRSITRWEQELKEFPDKESARYVLDGLKFGESLGVDFEKVKMLRVPCAKRSLQQKGSTDGNVQKFLREEIRTEIKAGRMAGPFSEPPFPFFVVNPMFAVRKNSDPQCTKFRRIDNLSWPEGASINDCIDKYDFPVVYPKFTEIAKKLWRMGRGALISKEDLKDAYKQLRLHPEDWKFTGVCFEGYFYFSSYPVFGSSSSPGNFERYSSVTEWTARRHGVGDLVHYLDDFLLISNPDNESLARSRLRKFREIVASLGWTLKTEKAESLRTSLTYLGVKIDTEKMTFEIPKEKFTTTSDTPVYSQTHV